MKGWIHGEVFRFEEFERMNKFIEDIGNAKFVGLFKDRTGRFLYYVQVMEEAELFYKRKGLYDLDEDELDEIDPTSIAPNVPPFVLPLPGRENKE